MRWSNSMKLHEYDQYREYLEHEGIYEIGHIRGPTFYPKYIGKSVNLYRRMRTYNNPNRCHNESILHRLHSEYRNLWFHVIRVNDAAWSESKLLITHGIKDEGLYEFNGRYEWLSKRRIKDR